MKGKAIIAGFGMLAVLVLMAWTVSVRMAGQPMPSTEGSLLPGVIADLAGTSGRGSSGLPVLANQMPAFSGIASWLNSEPLTAEGLKGKVVLIDFWTYSCINCIRTLPYVTSWHGKYADKGLVVVGVHTPEFAFEKVEKNVRDATKRHDIAYPVALDNDYATWDNYNNRYWPAHYLFDAKGRLRYTHFGEGQYDTMEKNIQALLAEAGSIVKAPVTEMESTVDFGQVGTPETYLGYAREEFFGSAEPILRDDARRYTVDASPDRNLFYLGGTWRIERERAVLTEAPGEIVYRYLASDANLVLGPGKGAKVRAIVTIDGAPVPAALRGADIVEEGGMTMIIVDEERLYSLVSGKGSYADRELRIQFLDVGVEAYAFTFG
jgi:thiol-disulfide isomerase/thioredoxin